MAVKLRLNLQGNDQDALLDVYIDEIGQRILDYCNLREIPDEIIPVWAAIVADCVKVDQASSSDILGEGAAKADSGKSISEGDTSISFGTSQSATAAALSGISSELIDNLLRNYRLSLHRWRRVPW